MDENPAKPKHNILLKVVLMSVQRLFLLILILIIGCNSVSAERGINKQSTDINQNNPVNTTNSVDPTPETKNDMQLDINKKVLLNDPNEENRKAVASLLLSQENTNARDVLIETLYLPKNNSARMAICKALIQARTAQKEIINRQDFIEPLLSVFSTETAQEASLAADAILIYKYQEIGPLLDELVTDPNKPSRTRINVIEALKKFPEMGAIIRLYRLVDDSDKDVAAEAGQALRSLGFQIGTNSSERKIIINNLRNKGIVQVLRELLINQTTKINEGKDEIESLKTYHLSTLEYSYAIIGTNETSIGKFLGKYLGDSHTWVKSWALNKVIILRNASGTGTTIPVELEPILISLISDPSKEIRLKTVNLLAETPTMRTADSASQLITQLLQQFDVEQDDLIRNKLLDTLGIAASKAKTSPETMRLILAHASDFLSRDDTKKAQIGARVMSQLLETEGLQEQEIQTSIEQLSKRYSRLKDDPNDTLMGELLNTMAGLVTENSVSKESARKAFEQFFISALDHETDFIRETAINGLIKVNKIRALEILRDHIKNEKSIKARELIIKLAEEIGGKNDLEWLADMLGSATNSEAKQVWATMKSIFDKMEIDTLNSWENQLISSSGKYKLNNEQREIDFLRIVQTKTDEEKKPRYYEQIANRHFTLGQYEQAVNYFTLYYNSPVSSEEKDKISPKLLDACLRWPNEKRATEWVLKSLTNQDIDSNNNVILTIENYFKDPGILTGKNAVLESLKGIDLVKQNPLWQERLKKWDELLKKKEPEQSNISVPESEE